MSDFDDLLGEPRPVRQSRQRTFAPRDRGRPSHADIKFEQDILRDYPVPREVPIQWLSRVFNKPINAVIDALKTVKPTRIDDRNVPYYQVAKAAPYLVDLPEDAGAEFFKNVKPEQLPLKMREGYWNAKTKELKYRVLAQELWPGEAVMEVLSDTFQVFTATSRLWADDLEEGGQLTDAQRQYLKAAVDRLCSLVREKLISKAEVKFTESFVAELDQ